MKIYSYNINGIRAGINKGILDWIKEEDPTVLCFQEVKALEEQIDIGLFKALGYEVNWHAAEKKGYSGVAVLSKVPMNKAIAGGGTFIEDNEGRILCCQFEQFWLVNAYIPSGSRSEERQAFKMDWIDRFRNYLNDLRKQQPHLIVCGDYNIAHKAIDIHDPVSNKNTPGFLPEEREWMDKLLEDGFIDSFRKFNEAPDQYSWWSYRAGSRARNKGWRLDYHLVSSAFADTVSGAGIHSDVVHSDHCPVSIELAI